MSQSSDILKLCKQPLPKGWVSRITGKDYTRNLDLVDDRVYGVTRISVRTTEAYSASAIGSDGRKGCYPPRAAKAIAAEVDQRLEAWYAAEAEEKRKQAQVQKRLKAEAEARKPLYKKLCLLLGAPATDPDALSVEMGPARFRIRDDGIEIDISGCYQYHGTDPAGAIKILKEVIDLMTPRPS